MDPPALPQEVVEDLQEDVPVDLPNPTSPSPPPQLEAIVTPPQSPQHGGSSSFNDSMRSRQSVVSPTKKEGFGREMSSRDGEKNFDGVLKGYLEDRGVGGWYTLFEQKGITFEMMAKMPYEELSVLVTDKLDLDRITSGLHVEQAVVKKEAVTYETQRWFPIVGWGKKRMPTDIPEWCGDPSGERKPLCREQIILPKNANWCGQWAIDRSGGDKEGWVYAGDWWWAWHDTQKKSDCVRKRKWVRKFKVESGGGAAPGKPMLLKIDNVTGKLGLVLNDQMVLTEIEPSSMADVCGASSYIGQRLVALNGEQVGSPSDVKADPGSYLTLLFSPEPCKERQPEVGPHKIFPTLPSAERLVDDFQCSYAKSSLHKIGRMYITHNFVCFASRMCDPLQIPLSQVSKVEKKTGALMNTISLHTTSGEHPFTGFFNIDPAYQLLERLQTVSEAPPPPVPALPDLIKTPTSPATPRGRNPLTATPVKLLEIGDYSVVVKLKTPCLVYDKPDESVGEVIGDLPPGTVVKVVEAHPGVVRIAAPDGYVVDLGSLVKNTSISEATGDKANELKKLFQNLQDREQVVDSYQSSFKAKNHIDRVGRLWLTDHRLVFTSQFLTQPLDVPLSDITGVTKKSDLLLLKAIEVATEAEVYTFTAFMQRDTAFGMIHRLWGIKTEGKPKKVEEKPKQQQQQQQQQQQLPQAASISIDFQETALSDTPVDVLSQNPSNEKFSPLPDLLKKMKQIIPETDIGPPTATTESTFAKLFVESGFLESYHKARGSYTGQKSDPKPVEIPPFASGCRSFQCVTVIQAPWTKHTRYDEYQRYIAVNEDGKEVVYVHIASQTPEVTYGDAFRVEALVKIAGGKITVSAYIHFLKSTMLKGKIETTGMGELKVSYALFLKMAEKWVGEGMGGGGGREAPPAPPARASPTGGSSTSLTDILDITNPTPLHAILLVPLYFAFSVVSTYFTSAALLSEYAGVAAAFSLAVECAQDPSCDPAPHTASLVSLLNELGPEHPYYLSSASGVIASAQFAVLASNFLLMVVSGLGVYLFMKG